MLVVLVDEHHIARESLATTLRAAGMNVRDFAGFPDALPSVSQADVFLLQCIAGLTVADELTEAAKDPTLAKRTLIISDWVSHVDRLLLQELGIGGILTKSHKLQELLQAIESIGAGQEWVQQSAGRRRTRRRSPNLSVQEERAARLVLEGLANKEIAERMQISESYVKGLLQRVFLKLGVRSRAELIRLGLIGSLGGKEHFGQRRAR